MFLQEIELTIKTLLVQWKPLVFQVEKQEQKMSYLRVQH